MSKADLRREPQTLVEGQWWYFEEDRWLHLIHRVAGPPPVTYTIAIPWKKLRESLRRHDKLRSKSK